MSRLLQMTDIRENLSTKVTAAVAVALGALVIALASQFRVSLPFSPVPITAQTLAVMLVATALGARKGALAVLGYIAGGLIGLPVFVAGRLLGPTGGYLIGFIFAAWAIGALMHDVSWSASQKWWYVPLVLLLGHVVIYTFGLAWLSFYVGSQHVLAVGLLPFLPGDVLKLVCAASIIRLGFKS